MFVHGMDVDALFEQARFGCHSTPAGCKSHMENLLCSIFVFRDAGLLDYIESSVLRLKEKSRRCLAMYGAVRGLASGSSWQSDSYDASNCIYAGVWTTWKGETPWNKCPTAQGITNINSAGNVMEAMLGVAWLHKHCTARTIDEFRHYLESDDYDYFVEVADEVFPIIDQFGSALMPWVVWLEEAITAYKGVWDANPQIQCTTRNYNAEVQDAHIEAVRFGFPSAFPFLQQQVPVLPRESWHLYPEETELAIKLSLVELSDSPRIA